MGFIIGLLTLVMVVDCIVLILLVLIQLPKKEAGAGLAFGGAATDALFGAGTGTVLTKITKYAATIFFVLAIILAIMQRTYSTRRANEFRRILESGKPAVVAPARTTSAEPGAPPSATTTTNIPLTLPSTALTNVEAPLTTNAAPAR